MFVEVKGVGIYLTAPSRCFRTSLGATMPSSSLTTLIFFFVATSMADVTIKSRREWGAALPKEPLAPIHGAVPWVIIHHSDGNNGCSGKPCSDIVRNIQSYHMDVKNWLDIGYNFLVGPTGEVFEGRGWGKVGAHAPRYNDKSVGICLIGDYHQDVSPPEAQLKATKELISKGVREGSVQSSYRLVGHRQVRETSCPGDKLYAIIKKWPGYTTKVD